MRGRKGEREREGKGELKEEGREERENRKEEMVMSGRKGKGKEDEWGIRCSAVVQLFSLV